MTKLLSVLRTKYSGISFVPKDSFYWSPRTSTVFYVPEALEGANGQWSLLHELGHALLGHSNFKSDFGLLKLESEAWIKAQEEAKNHTITIDPDHIEDCLDSYRDWLYQRSTCPGCLSSSLQIEPRKYRCFNCNNLWNVSSSRTCRTYRKNQKASVIEAF